MDHLTSKGKVYDSYMSEIDEKIHYWELMILKKESLNHYAGKSWHASQSSRLATIAMGFEKPADYIGRVTRRVSFTWFKK